MSLGGVNTIQERRILFSVIGKPLILISPSRSGARTVCELRPIGTAISCHQSRRLLTPEHVQQTRLQWIKLPRQRTVILRPALCGLDRLCPHGSKRLSHSRAESRRQSRSRPFPRTRSSCGTVRPPTQRSSGSGSGRSTLPDCKSPLGHI